jgi:hypothetical protein
MSKHERKSDGHSLRAFNKVDKMEIVNRKFILHNVSATAATDLAGTLSYTTNLDPSVAQDWGLISAYYDEFRVIGVKIHLTSLQQFSVTALNGLGIILMDNDSSTVNTYVSALQYANKRWIPAVFTHQNCKVPVFSFKRPEDKTSPIPWIDVATASGSLGSIQIVFAPAALTASISYFNVGIEFLLEARGRR